MTAIVETLPIRTVSESNVRGHWAGKARRAKAQRVTIGLVLRARLMGRRVLPCTVVLTRLAPRRLDDDNLRGALKACRDGVADALGVDDRDPRVAWAYDQERGQPKECAVRVCIVPEG